MTRKSVGKLKSNKFWKNNFEKLTPPKIVIIIGSYLVPLDLRLLVSLYLLFADPNVTDHQGMSVRQSGRLKGTEVEYGPLPPVTCTRKPKPGSESQQPGKDNLLGESSNVSSGSGPAALQ